MSFFAKGDIEKEKKKYNPLEVKFALKKWRRGKLTSNQLTRLALQSGDSKKFYEDFNKATNFSVPVAVKRYEKKVDLNSGDIEAREELEKHGFRNAEDEEQRREGKIKIIPPKIKGSPVKEVILNPSKMPSEEVEKKLLSTVKGSRRKLNRLNESVVNSLTIYSLEENETLKAELSKDIAQKTSWEKTASIIAAADKRGAANPSAKLKEKITKWGKIAKGIKEIIHLYDYKQRRGMENRRVLPKEKKRRKR